MLSSGSSTSQEESSAHSRIQRLIQFSDHRVFENMFAKFWKAEETPCQ